MHQRRRRVRRGRTSRSLVCLIGDEGNTARFSTVLPGQGDDHGSELGGPAWLGLEDGEQGPGLSAIDAWANDDAPRVFEPGGLLFTHNVTRVPGSTIRTAVVGARRTAVSWKCLGSLSFFVRRRSPNQPLVKAK
jgi:hypothetical protein